jgi:hypothetical protein
MSLIFIGVSVILGLKLLTRMHNSKFDYPWLRVLGLASLIALLSLALLNLTPLCVKQNNGDSTNN